MAWMFYSIDTATLGFDLGRTQTPITPLMIGDAQRAKWFSAELFKARIFAQALAFPTVPRDTARLRLMLSATHTRDDLDYALQTLACLGRDCQIVG